MTAKYVPTRVAHSNMNTAIIVLIAASKASNLLAASEVNLARALLMVKI
jgi:hypothetical protein